MIVVWVPIALYQLLVGSAIIDIVMIASSTAAVPVVPLGRRGRALLVKR
jgi:hypothetical protein